MFMELLYNSSNWLYSSAMLLRVVVPVSSILYLRRRKRPRICLVRCDDGLVISSDSSKTRHSFLELRLTNLAMPRFSLPSMEVDRTMNTPSGTASRSALFLATRNCSLFIERKGIHVILVAMAGASMMTFRTLRNLSRYLARWYTAAVLPEPCCQFSSAWRFCKTRFRSCFWSVVTRRSRRPC